MLVPNLGKVAHIFTNDADVVRLLQQVFPIVALYQIFDQCQGAFYGPFRGTGRLRESAVVVFVSFWVVGLPLAMILCFHSRLQLGLFGLWLGMAVGSAFAAIGEGSFVWFFINYEKEAIAGKLRSDAAADELNNDTTSRKTQVHANSP